MQVTYSLPSPQRPVLTGDLCTLRNQSLSTTRDQTCLNLKFTAGAEKGKTVLLKSSPEDVILRILVSGGKVPDYRNKHLTADWRVGMWIQQQLLCKGSPHMGFKDPGPCFLSLLTSSIEPLTNCASQRQCSPYKCVILVGTLHLVDVGLSFVPPLSIH